jgi:hypothetical protein
MISMYWLSKVPNNHFAPCSASGNAGEACPLSGNKAYGKIWLHSLRRALFSEFVDVSFTLLITYIYDSTTLLQLM